MEILHGVSLDVEKGMITSLIGPNGAGKTTVLRTMSGQIHPKSGQVILKGGDISHLAPHKVTELGLIQVPEGRQILGTLTVLQNLFLGCYSQYNSLGKQGRNELLDSVFTMFPILSERRKQMAGTLSGGEQQMLALGRALMGQPKVLLMDEPSLGLAPLITEQVYSAIVELSNTGITILLAEQNARAALELAEQCYLLELGKVVLHGKSKEIAKDDRVRQAYLT